jgi:hypothetical protein
MQPVPDVEIELPQGWMWLQRDASPLAIEAPSGGGTLQISAPPAGSGWRGEVDLEGFARRTLPRMNLGTVEQVEHEDTGYGRAVRAKLVGDGRFDDVVAWVVLHDTHDPLLVTWIANTRTEAREMAHGVVARLAPGGFSREVDRIVSVARSDLATHGTLDRHCVFFCGDGAVHVVYFEETPQDIEREAIRFQSKRCGARVVARVGMARVESTRGSELVGYVHAESPSRRKRFLLPADASGREVYEVRTDTSVISDFFVEPDPVVADKLARFRTIEQPRGDER